MESNVKQFADILNSMLNTYERKNHDYGNSFEQSLNKFGSVAGIVRLADKMNRLETLVKKEAKVKDESIKDTLLDMANYAVMTLMWLEKNNK
jgi:glutaredoxin 2